MDSVFAVRRHATDASNEADRASPPASPTGRPDRSFTRADDRARTGDLNLGKVALYQLSYVRGGPPGLRLRWVRGRP